MARERFVEVYSQGVTNIRKIIVDTETGVNYLLLSSNMTSGCGANRRELFKIFIYCSNDRIMQ